MNQLVPDLVRGSKQSETLWYDLLITFSLRVSPDSNVTIKCLASSEMRFCFTLTNICVEAELRGFGLHCNSARLSAGPKALYVMRHLVDRLKMGIGHTQNVKPLLSAGL